MESPANKFLDLIQHPLKFRYFLLKKLPSAYFCGVRLKYADHTQAQVTVPYKWFSKNPFNSIYFACLSMAAEMSTGILAMMNTWKKEPSISMLVIKTEAVYTKKATGACTFTCEDGVMIEQAVKEAAASGKNTTIAARSKGIDEKGDIVAEFVITWSFKAKSN